jgi:hypothetical protein
VKRPLVTAITATCAALLLAGCAASPSPTSADASVLSHVHGLGFDQGDDAILVATHTGIYRINMAGSTFGEPSGPVGGFTFDAMGFTTTGALTFASGHPGPITSDTFQAPNLGLLASSDYANSWDAVSLSGETDFHDLTASPSDPYRIFGLEGTSLQRSDNAGSSWETVGTLEARDIQTLADNADVVFATTPDGLKVSTNSGASFALIPDAPRLLLITDGVSSDRFVGIDVDGVVWSQDDPAEGWTSGGTVVGVPQALMVMPASGRIIVADDRGISMSDDRGESWTTVWATADQAN